MRKLIERIMCSIIALATLTAAVLGLYPGGYFTGAAATEITDQDKLGDWIHYNGLIFGSMTSYTADAEGAVAVGGEYAHLGVGGGYDVGGSYSFAPTAQLGAYTNPNGYPTLLLGTEDIKVGSLTNSSTGGHFNVFGGPIVMSPELKAIHDVQANKLVASTGANWAVADKDLIASWFDYQYRFVTGASSQYLRATSSSISLTEFSNRSYINAGPQTYRNETLMYNGQLDDKILVITVDTNSSVNFSGSTYLPVPGAWATEYELIIYNFPDAVNVTMSGDPQQLVTSLGSYNKTYPSYYLTAAQAEERDSICNNVIYNFPAAQNITMTSVFLMGSILAPDALVSANGGSINGQLTCGGFITQGSMELHALRLNSRARDVVEKPGDEAADVKIEKYLYYGSAKTTPLEGAQFHLFRYNKEQELYVRYSNETYTTDPDGTVTISGLPLGRYRLQEIKAPEGAQLNDSDPGNEDTYYFHVFDLDSAGEALVIRRYNEPLTLDLVFRKEDGETERSLEGAEFQLIRLADRYEVEEVVFTRTSDGNGLFQIGNLPMGTYVLKELSPPNGYQRMEDITFQVYDEDGALKVRRTDTGAEVQAGSGNPYPVKNQRGEADNRVFLFKYDGAGSLEHGTAQGLEGAEFRLYRLDKDQWILVDLDIETGATGYFTIDNLTPGVYRLVETAPPAGYRATNRLTDPDHFPEGYAAEFTVEDDDREVYVNIPNTALTAGFRLVKRSGVEGESALLSGASFSLLNNSGETVATGTSNEQGVISFPNLPAGTYRLKETKAPEGFLLLTEEILLTLSFDDKDQPVVSAEYKGEGGSVSWDGDTMELSVYNAPATGSVLLYKVDQDMYQNGVDWDDDKTFTINYLAGAVFQLERKENGFSGNYVSFGSTFTSTFTGTQDQYGNNLAAASLDGLPYGDYRVLEIQAPGGYTAVTENGVVGNFTITKGMADASLEVELEATNAKDVPRGTVTVKKVDAEDHSTPVPGVEFKLWIIDDPQGILNGRQHVEDVLSHVAGFGQNKYATSAPLITGDDGTIRLDLEPGLYVLFEYGPADGYLYTLERGQTLERATDPAFYDYTYLFRVVAVDEKDKDAGVRIKWIDRYKILNGEVIDFDVDAHDVEDWNQALFSPEEYLSFAITNKKEDLRADVQFRKTGAPDPGSEAGSQPLEGARFQLRYAAFQEGDDPVYTDLDYSATLGTYPSGPDGLVLMKGLAAGMYLLEEIAAPEGYVLLDSPIYFSLRVNGYSKMLDLYDGEGNLVMAGYDEPTVNRDGSASGDPAFHTLLQLGNVENAPGLTGGVTIYKEDGENNERLPGAVFSLYQYQEAEIIIRSGGGEWNLLFSGLTTGQDGSLSLSGLSPGRYKLVETSPPDHYLDGDVEIVFLLTEEEGEIHYELESGDWAEPGVLVIQNQREEEAPLGDVQFRKEDGETGEPLSGAVFDLYRREETSDEWSPVLNGLTSGQGGLLTIPGLEPGSYRLVETSPPPNYRDSGWEVLFTLSRDGDEFLVHAEDGTWDGDVLVITNQREDTDPSLGEITLRKTDGETGEPLSGAVFDLYRQGEEWTQIHSGLTTNGDGLLTASGLEPGVYKLVETSPPHGYRNSGVETLFLLLEEEDGVHADPGTGEWDEDGFLLVANQREEEPEQPGGPTGSIDIRKVDGEDGAALSGAVFDLYREGESNPILTGLRTGSGGVLTIEDLPAGSYRLVETQAPEGYQDPGREGEVEFEMILEDGAVIPAHWLDDTLDPVRYTLFRWVDEDEEEQKESAPQSAADNGFAHEEDTTPVEETEESGESSPDQEIPAGNDEVSTDPEESQDPKGEASGGESGRETEEMEKETGDESSTEDSESGGGNEEDSSSKETGQEEDGSREEGEETHLEILRSPAAQAIFSFLNGAGGSREDNDTGSWVAVDGAAYDTSSRGVLTLEGLEPGAYLLVPEANSRDLPSLELEWGEDDAVRTIQAVDPQEADRAGTPLTVENTREPGEKEESSEEESSRPGSSGGRDRDRTGDKVDTDRPSTPTPQKPDSIPEEIPVEEIPSYGEDSLSNPETGHGAAVTAGSAFLLTALGVLLYRRRLD